jgi:hypothetical protein
MPEGYCVGGNKLLHVGLDPKGLMVDEGIMDSDGHEEEDLEEDQTEDDQEEDRSYNQEEEDHEKEDNYEEAHLRGALGG